ncbi:hypothetical protein WAI453_013311 [Rhynchosporium graminicola]
MVAAGVKHAERKLTSSKRFLRLLDGLQNAIGLIVGLAYHQLIVARPSGRPSPVPRYLGSGMRDEHFGAADLIVWQSNKPSMAVVS